MRFDDKTANHTKAGVGCVCQRHNAASWQGEYWAVGTPKYRGKAQGGALDATTQLEVGGGIDQWMSGMESNKRV